MAPHRCHGSLASVSPLSPSPAGAPRVIISRCLSSKPSLFSFKNSSWTVPCAFLPPAHLCPPASAPRCRLYSPVHPSGSSLVSCSSAKFSLDTVPCLLPLMLTLAGTAFAIFGSVVLCCYLIPFLFGHLDTAMPPPSDGKFLEDRSRRYIILHST